MNRFLVLIAALLVTACGDALKEKGSKLANNQFCNGSASFCIAKIEAEEFGINSSTDELGLSNTKQFNFKACVTDPLGRSINTLRPFNISDGQTTKTAVANGDGCFQWTEQIAVDQISPQKIYVVKRTFSATDGNQGTNDVYFKFDPFGSKVYYDPYFTWNVPAEYIEEANVNFTGKVSAAAFNTTNASLVKLDSIDLENFRHDYFNYELDNDLNLTIAHKMIVSFSPTILKKSIGNIYDELEAKKGKVKAVFIFMRDNVNNPDLTDMANYITHLEHTFTINPNIQTIKEEVLFKWPDVSSIQTRMRVLVKVEPVVQSSAIKKAYFEGYLPAVPGTISLMNTKLNVDQIFNTFSQVIADANKRKVKPFARYIETMKSYENFAHLTAKDLECDPKDHIGEAQYQCSQNTKILEETFNRFLNDPSRFETSMPKDENYFLRALSKKLKVPQHYLQGVKSIKKVAFVENVLQKNLVPADVSIVPQYSINTSQNFSISNNEGTNYNENRGWSTSLGFNPQTLIGYVPVVGPLINYSLELGIGALGLAGVSPSYSLSVGASGGWSFGSARSRAVSIGASQSYQINANEIPIVVRAAMRECVFITVTPSPFGKRKAGNGADFTSIYCGEEIKAKEFVEHYYNIFDSLSQSTSQDNSSAERKWVMFIRGTPYFQLFRGLIENRVVEIKKGQPFSVRLDESALGNSEIFKNISEYRQKPEYGNIVAKVATLQTARTTQIAPGMILVTDHPDTVATWSKSEADVKATSNANIKLRLEKLRQADTKIYE